MLRPAAHLSHRIVLDPFPLPLEPCSRTAERAAWYRLAVGARHSRFRSSARVSEITADVRAANDKAPRLDLATTRAA